MEAFVKGVFQIYVERWDSATGVSDLDDMA